MLFKKPRLGFWQIINMNVGFFGIQYSFGLQQSAINPLYTFLHANGNDLTWLNFAGPATGLLIQPVIGAISDKTWHPRWGRRKPFFLIGAIFCSLCLFVFPFSSSLWMAAGLLTDPAKSYDNRWMHRPVIDWGKNNRGFMNGTVEHRVFSGTKRLLDIRRALVETADYKNLTWMYPHNIHVAGFIRQLDDKRLFCLFNFSSQPQYVTWYAFKEKGKAPERLYDHWAEKYHAVGYDNDYLVIDGYSFCILGCTGE